VKLGLGETDSDGALTIRPVYRMQQMKEKAFTCGRMKNDDNKRGADEGCK
jgi:hypothetical protein